MKKTKVELQPRSLDEQVALDEDEMEENDALVTEERDIEIFELPTSEQREEEKRHGGPDVQEVQRRMQECARVLGNFKLFRSKGRYVHHFGNYM